MPQRVTFLDPTCSCPSLTAAEAAAEAPTPAPACHHHHPDITEIMPGLFLGNLAAAESPETLASHGITHVLSITSTVPVVPPGYVHKHHLLHDDHNADLLAILPDCAARIEYVLADTGKAKASDVLRSVAASRKILVHCCMGRSRSGAVVVGYVMKYHQLPYDSALALVVAKRPVVRPNSGFVGMLRFWGACGGSPWVEEEIREAVVGRARPKRVLREGSRRRRCLLEEEWVVVGEVGAGCWEENGGVGGVGGFGVGVGMGGWW